ncbi:MAG: hypothetical protein K8S14_10550 [Actinomycetia bacterium]|nr:hypothetical protein [Actinomycetes bacterium]
MQWQKEKPNIPCIFVARGKDYNDLEEYGVYRLKMEQDPDSDGMYLAFYNSLGEEDCYEDFQAYEYLIIYPTMKD